MVERPAASLGVLGLVRLCLPGIGSLLSLPLYVLFVTVKCNLKFVEVFLLLAAQLNGLVLKQAAD